MNNQAYIDGYLHKEAKKKSKHDKKVSKVMGEFKDKKLKSSSGHKVTDRKQAIAIALSEAEKQKN